MFRVLTIVVVLTLLLLMLGGCEKRVEEASATGSAYGARSLI